MYTCPVRVGHFPLPVLLSNPFALPLWHYAQRNLVSILLICHIYVMIIIVSIIIVSYLINSVNNWVYLVLCHSITFHAFRFAVLADKPVQQVCIHKSTCVHKSTCIYTDLLPKIWGNNSTNINIIIVCTSRFVRVILAQGPC